MLFYFRKLLIREMLSRLAVFGGRIQVATLVRSLATSSTKAARFEGGWNRYAQQVGSFK